SALRRANLLRRFGTTRVWRIAPPTTPVLLPCKSASEASLGAFVPAWKSSLLRALFQCLLQDLGPSFGPVIVRISRQVQRRAPLVVLGRRVGPRVEEHLN